MVEMKKAIAYNLVHLRFLWKTFILLLLMFDQTKLPDAKHISSCLYQYIPTMFLLSTSSYHSIYPLLYHVFRSFFSFVCTLFYSNK